jgi:hypothetical protein
METREQIIKGKIEYGKRMLNFIYYLREEYYRKNGVHPTTVIMSANLFRIFELVNRWYLGPLCTKTKSGAGGSVFGLSTQIDFDMDDNEIRVANVMGFRYDPTPKSSISHDKINSDE